MKLVTPASARLVELSTRVMRTAALSFVRGVGDADAVEADPGEDALHEAATLGQRAQRRHHAAIHQPEVAGVLGDLDAAAGAHQRIESARSGALEEGFFAAVGAHAIDHVAALAPQLQHPRQQLGRVLAVAVEAQHDVALGVIDAGGEGGFLAEVAGEADQSGALVRRRLAHPRRGGVAAAIVYDQRVERQAVLRGDARDARQQQRQCLGLVEGGHDERDMRGRGAPGRGSVCPSCAHHKGQIAVEQGVAKCR